MEKYEVLIKFSDENIQSYKFETLGITASFLDLSINQLRERMSWFSSGLTKHVWHKNKYGTNYQVYKIQFKQ